MRRLLVLTSLIASLAVPAGAMAAGGAGFDGPSRALESAFKIALLERRESPDGCYPSAKVLARELDARTDLDIAVTKSIKSIRTRGIAYVVSGRMACNRAFLAMRGKRGLYVLDSDEGPIYVIGADGERLKGKDQIVGGAGKLRSVSLRSQTAPISIPDDVQRRTVACPSKTYPLGGGMLASPGPDTVSREGVYPHSYERLGVQRGWHINPVLVDPDNTTTTPRNVTVQVMCGRGLVPTDSPHKTIFVKPGQTKVANARCGKGTKIIGGGFQRSDFRTPSGSYPLESRAVGAKTWRVTGRAFGAFGGEITSIAYCAPAKEAKTTVVQASTPILLAQFAQATTPACPKGTVLVNGGFSTNGATGIFSEGGHFNADSTWSAGGFGYFGPASSYTAYGYCVKR